MLMVKISSRWVFMIVLVSSFLLVIAGHWLSGRLQPEILLELPHDPACDLRLGSCTSNLPEGGKVTFGIEPRTLPVLKPLALSVSVEGVITRRVEANFNGVDMNMGLNHAELPAAGEGKFNGTITIPVCIRDSMEWEAKVLLHTPNGIIAVPYRFWTGK
ncbi:MAG: hypothetical protein PHE17_19180 [Thiothrix sp.]|uniref:hypothetical protein n=1 Tax=Thiothrix sp. TaxID=1032 RepID=UPI002619C66E|nr:hypothetical protein [Thiothrix sp.]MDD5395150.1 hypothetical protein [Thiothrix sp.]